MTLTRTNISKEAARFPLTLALSLGERENRSPSRWKTCDGICGMILRKAKGCDCRSLSPRERARVRGNSAQFANKTTRKETLCL